MQKGPRHEGTNCAFGTIARPPGISRGSVHVTQDLETTSWLLYYTRKIHLTTKLII